MKDHMSNEPSTRRLKVRFTVEYEALVCVGEDDNITDAVSDIDIPERPGCEYVAGTFEVERVFEEESGKAVEWQRDEEDELDDNDDIDD